MQIEAAKQVMKTEQAFNAKVKPSQVRPPAKDVATGSKANPAKEPKPPSMWARAPGTRRNHHRFAYLQHVC